MRAVNQSKKRSSAFILAATAALTVAGNVAFATTFTWTRASTPPPGSNNWDNAGNWAGGVAPPQVQPTGDTTDILYTGTVFAAHTSSNMRQDYAINSITWTADFDHQTGTSTYNASTPSTLIAPTAHLSLGAGGITSDVTAFNIGVSRNAAIPAGSAELILTADQTWSLNAAGTFATGTITFTINRKIRGTADVIKTGTGLLVLAEDNPDWAGDFTLVNGAVRTGGAGGQNLHFGTGVITHASDNEVTITASTVNGLGGDRLFQNDLVLGGTGRFNFSGSFNLGLGTMSTVTLNSDKIWGISRITDINGTITGPGGIDKRSDGMMVMHTANSYIGSTIVDDGVIRVRDSGGLGSGSASVTVDTGGALEFENGISIVGKALSIEGVGNDADTPPPGVDVNQGAISNRSGSNSWSGPVTVTAADTFVNVPAGALDLGGGVTGNGTASMRVAGAGALSTKHVRLGGLQLDAGARLKINPNGTADGRSNLGTLNIAGGSAAPTAQLDLTNNALVLDSVTEADALALITAGRAGGSWNGNGITSSTAAGNSSAAIGYATAAAVPAAPIFGTVDPTDVLLRYTLNGDADLSGTVDIGDFALLAANFNIAGGWSKGDSNYDNLVDIGDFALLAANFNQSVADLPRGAVVPEPSAMLAVPAALLLRRRK